MREYYSFILLFMASFERWLDLLPEIQNLVRALLGKNDKMVLALCSKAEFAQWPVAVWPPISIVPFPDIKLVAGAKMLVLTDLLGDDVRCIAFALPSFGYRLYIDTNVWVKEVIIIRRDRTERTNQMRYVYPHCVHMLRPNSPGWRRARWLLDFYKIDIEQL
jgi:hypothetical protein